MTEPAVNLLIDEKKGRAVAAATGLNIIGSLKILVLAKRRNIIDSVQVVVDELSSNNFRSSKTVVESLLRGWRNVTLNPHQHPLVKLLDRRSHCLPFNQKAVVPVERIDNIKRSIIYM